MEKPDSYHEFMKTLDRSRPDSDWPEDLKAMWYAAKGNWEASHDIAQEMHTVTGSWIHAFLHRQEGDNFNAGYWYRQANRAFPSISFDEEHQEITENIIIS
ncbi:MAG: hypothetical protein HKN31_09770 [Pricia sp.]|nr:hypothetical protein [Pricia sp.]